MLENKISRKSNFELLRIISILLITFHHLSMTYGLDSSNMYIRLWAQFFFIGGKIGVNCFVLIGAYFLYDRNFKIERVIKIHREVVIYGVVGLLVLLALNPETLTLKAILKAFFPILFDHYWFVTIYVALILIAPFLNIFIRSISFKQHTTIIVLCVFLFSIIPTFTTQTPYNDNLSWFCFLYIIAAYLKKYETAIKSKLGNIYLVFILWGGIFVSSLIMTILESRIPFLHEGVNFFSGMYILPEFIISVSLFLIFEKKQLYSTFINHIGKHTLAFYLVQSNYSLIIFRIYLLDKVFNMFNIYLYPLIALILVMVLFTLITIFDIGIKKIDELKHTQVLTRIEIKIFYYVKEKILEILGGMN